MKKFTVAMISLAALVGVLSFAPASVANAANDPTTDSSPAGQIQSGVDAVGGADEEPLGTRLQDVINILLYVLGAIAVIMIVVGGVRYTTSNGESSQITSAKNTILYAVIGLVVAIMAYAIVNFVVTSF